MSKHTISSWINPEELLLFIFSGVCRPGMNAILGSTGSGKTTLLDVLAGRKDANGLIGTVLIDGYPIPHNFKCMVGYVVQEDYMMATLTVRETLMFSANLRLPSSYTFADRVEKVNDIIQELGLSDCAMTKVGNDFIRGISGGEKKRTNIGMELILSYPLLFLDEPTTGLDASTAYAVMMMLKKLALSGRTIIFSIHQPRFAIFKLFDELTLLSKGDVVYQGPANYTLEYFREMGYVCEEYNNPADFILDVANGDSMLIQNNGSVNMEDIDAKSVSKSELARLNLQRELVRCYEESNWNTNLLKELEGIDHVYKSKNNRVDVVKQVNYKSSRLRQFLIISERAGKSIVRNPETLFVQVFAAVVLALIGGVLFYQLGDESAIQNRRGAMFFIALNWIFDGLSAFETFVKNRELFIHEHSSGFYPVSSYCLANFVCDIIPLRFLRSGVYGVITYWMVGFRPEVDAFFTYLLVIFLAHMAACAVAFAVGASSRSYSIGNTVIVLIYVFMMVFAGLLIQLDTIDVWIRWFKWFSIFRHSFEDAAIHTYKQREATQHNADGRALSILELKGRNFCGATNSSSTPTVMCDGNEHLTSQGIDYDADWNVWSNILALAGITTACLIVTYIQILRMKKTK